MSRTSRKRLKKASARIEALPIAQVVEDAAYARFKETGELPDHRRLAMACTDRALKGGQCSRGPIVLNRELGIRQLERIARMEEPEPGWVPPRELLFHEAVDGWVVVRMAARSAIKVLMAIGRDVEDPDFVPEDLEVPDWGGVGMGLLGFPECLVKAPYEKQAERVFGRLDDLRARVNQDDEAWMEAYGEAAIAFLHQGVLPDEELMREAVLANGELMGLVAHYLGVGNPAAMDAYDEAARGTSAERVRALERLQAMGEAGELLPEVTT